MIDIKELNQRSNEAKRAFQIQSQKLKDAENELILARVKRPVDERKIRNCEKAIKIAKDEVVKIKDLLSSLDAEKVTAREEQKSIETLTLEQKKLVDKMKAESANLLKTLCSAQAINERLLQQNARYNMLEKQTGKRVDRTKTSGGFNSLRALVEICESECSGKGRTMFTFPHNYPV